MMVEKGTLIYEDPKLKENKVMIRGFSIFLTIFILFFIIYTKFYDLFWIIILCFFLIITVIFLFLENPKIYTNGIMIGGLNRRSLFCSYNSIKKINIIEKEEKGKKYQVIQIYCFNHNDPIQFDNKFDSDDDFFKMLKKVLDKKIQEHNQ